MRWLALALLCLGCDDSGGGEADPQQDVRSPGLVDAQRPDSAAGDARITPEDDARAEPDSASPDSATTEADAAQNEGALSLLPARATLELGEGPLPSLQYALELIPVQGDAQPVDAREAAWSVTPPALGEVDEAGLFRSSGMAGSGRVRAEWQGLSAEAVVDVQSFEDFLAPGTPPDAPERFEQAAPGADCAPNLVYPAPLTAFPRNIQGVEFQWQASHELYALEFTAGQLSIRWFTAGQALIPDGEPWAALLRNASGNALRLRFRGLRSVGGAAQACEGPELSFLIDPSTLAGAVYYWSTTDAGIMRLAQGDTAPEPLLTPAVAPEINCPACHALSRDGTRIAFTRTTFPPFGDLATSLIELPRELSYEPTGVLGYFPSFAPNGERIVAGAGGQLLIREFETGAEVGRLPMPMDRVGGSPDWSWQGEAIVAAYGASGLANPLPDVGISGGDIAEWAADDADWSDPMVLVQRDGDSSLDRPAYSPEGGWIAYERKGRDPDPESDGNPNTELWVYHRDSGQTVRLDGANGLEPNGNAWPKWAVTDNRGRLWVAFSSLRPYGNIVGREVRPQLWVAGIDPGAEPGTDPSSPAFWLPYQNPQSGNHIPYWAVFHKE